jgi:hypothetical protein
MPGVLALLNARKALAQAGDYGALHELGKKNKLDVFRHPTRMGEPFEYALKPIEQGESFFHGGPKSIKHIFTNQPTFMARNFEGAEGYVGLNHPSGYVSEFETNVLQPAHLRDLLELGLIRDDPELEHYEQIMEPYLSDAFDNNFSHDGTNALDVVYSPKAREILKGEGFDSVFMNDAFERHELEALVPLTSNTARFKKAHKVEY